MPEHWMPASTDQIIEPIMAGIGKNDPRQRRTCFLL
jgi:hypothetical protein